MNRKYTENNHTIFTNSAVQPLAAKLRPRSLEEVVGQQHLIGPGMPLRVAVEQGRLFSFILWGPPGVGKTTIAQIYSRAVEGELHELSAVSAGKEDIRQVLTASQTTEKPTILFLDEIHRFNKAQQDFLLPYVESGQLILIGATTENPSFEVIPALLSRCKVFVLEPLNEAEMKGIIKRTGLPIDEQTMDWLAGATSGDARQAIGLIEQAHALYGKLTKETINQASQVSLRYDKKGDEHYNTISAFIKSMRASNPNAAIYYLARMLEAGEDPLFIARRMVIFASEDIGLAQPTALVVANAVFRAVETVGLPEAGINLAHGVVYLAQSKKDRRAYEALQAALQTVKNTGNLPIPLSIRNAPTGLMKELGYGEGYEMYSEVDLLPDVIKEKKFIE